GHVFARLGGYLRNLLRRLHGIAGNVDGADQDILAFEQPNEAHRHSRIAALQRDLADAALGYGGEDGLVLTPLAAQGGLPIDVGLDAVAVADVDGGGAREAGGGPLERGDAPIGHLVHEHVEGRLVEL